MFDFKEWINSPAVYILISIAVLQIQMLDVKKGVNKINSHSIELVRQQEILINNKSELSLLKTQIEYLRRKSEK